MANANKNKGKAFEREIANHLTSVFGMNFQRVPNSGAFIGGMNAHRMKFMSAEQQLLACGDLIVPTALDHIQLEMKFYKTFSFQSVYDNNEQLNKWIEQAKGSSGKYWFLVMKFNNMGRYLVFDKVHEPLFKLIDNRTIYKDKYLLCKYDGFFETNKELILKLNPKYTEPKCELSNTTTTQLSASIV